MTRARVRLPLLLGLGLLLASAPLSADVVIESVGEHSSFSCRACHTRIWEEWAGSTHARAYDSPLFQARYRARGRPGSCLRCHAPEGIFETGLGRVPRARRRNREEGVSCISCHHDGHAFVGPHDTHDAAHATVRDGAIRSVGMCASCHAAPCEGGGGHEGQLHPYLHSPQRHESSCQSCHMPALTAPTVDLARPRYPRREGRSHAMEASRDPEVLRAAVSLEAEVAGKFLYLEIANRASAHMLPGGPERALVLETLFTDSNGLEYTHEVEYLMARTRTRLRPAEVRSYRYLLRPHYRGAETRLYHRLFEEQSRPDWVLLERVTTRLDGGGPVHARPELIPGEAEGVPPYFGPPDLRTP